MLDEIQAIDVIEKIKEYLLQQVRIAVKFQGAFPQTELLFRPVPHEQEGDQ